MRLILIYRHTVRLFGVRRGCLTGSIKGVDLYPWLGGMIGAKIFSAMDQSNQSGRSVWQVAPLPSA